MGMPIGRISPTTIVLGPEFAEDVRKILRAHAPRCTFGNCKQFAFYHGQKKINSGMPRDYILCEDHKNEIGATKELPTADAIRRVLEILPP